MVRYTPEWNAAAWNGWVAKIHRPQIDRFNDEVPEDHEGIDPFEIWRILNARYGNVTRKSFQRRILYRTLVNGEPVRWPTDTDSCSYETRDQWNDRIVTCECKFDE